MWTVQQYLVRPRAVLRCSICNVERIGNYTQAKAGLLRCWTCSPKPPPQPRKRKPKPKKERPPAPPPVLAAPPPRVPRPPREPGPLLPPIPGRLATNAHAYSRAVRHRIEDVDGVQHGRLELVGLRTRNPLNKRLTWQAAKSTADTVKRATIDALWEVQARPPEGHPWSYELRLSRVSTKMSVDDDGVTAALKAVRDAFAIFVRINDANRRYLRVSYGSGHGRVQGVVLEWTRFEGPLDEEEEAASFLFFDDDELVTLAAEHRVTRRYWKERMEKRLVSIATRPTGIRTTDDEAEEEAAYDIAEEDEGEGSSHESGHDG